jgi:hypothetical protein
VSNREEIIFEKDIIKSVADELGMHPKKISLHMTFLKNYINDFSRSEKHSLTLPHLGTMYRNLKGCARMNIYIEKTGLLQHEQKSAEFSKMFKKNREDIDGILSSIKGGNTISYHTSRRRIHHPFFTRWKKKKELEEFQNNERED